ncbi:MAG: glycoside hydrolase, partial [bacterium]|nr:glycoside hydrolase [bacterium]
EVVEVNPLLPAGAWDWFCLDRVQYHGRRLTILWDKSGEKYGRGAGLRVFADGVQVAHSPELGRITGRLPVRR